MRAGASLNGHPNRFVEKERRREKKEEERRGYVYIIKKILFCGVILCLEKKKTVSIFYKNVCALFLNGEPNGSERNMKSKREKVIIFFLL